MCGCPCPCHWFSHGSSLAGSFCCESPRAAGCRQGAPRPGLFPGSLWAAEVLRSFSRSPVRCRPRSLCESTRLCTGVRVWNGLLCVLGHGRPLTGDLPQSHLDGLRKPVCVGLVLSLTTLGGAGTFKRWGQWEVGGIGDVTQGYSLFCFQAPMGGASSSTLCSCQGDSLATGPKARRLIRHGLELPNL